MQDKLLSTKELSEYLGIAISTIIEYRMNNSGPIYAKLGHLVRYKKSDVEAWIESRKHKRRKRLFCLDLCRLYGMCCVTNV